MTVPAKPLLFGRSRHVSRRFLTLAGIVCFGVAAVLCLFAVAGFAFDWYAESVRAALLYGIGAVALAGAIGNAYLNDGLVVSVSITLAIALGYGLAAAILVSANVFVTDSPPTLLFVYFAAGAAVVGVGAFAFGVGIREVAKSVRAR